MGVASESSSNIRSVLTAGGTMNKPGARRGLALAATTLSLVALGLVVRPSRRNYSLKGIGDTRIAVVDRASPRAGGEMHSSL